MNAAMILLAFTLLFPIVSRLPRVALSAVIMVVAVQHFDLWSLQLIKRIGVSSGGQRRSLLIDLLVVVLVAVLSITVNIVLAVFLGTVIAVMLFVVRMSRSIIRRNYRCNAISSRKSRDSRESKALEAHGGSILVMELQAHCFSGPRERHHRRDRSRDPVGTHSLILDLRRVSEIDSTGARIIWTFKPIYNTQGDSWVLCFPSTAMSCRGLRTPAFSSVSCRPYL